MMNQFHQRATAAAAAAIPITGANKWYLVLPSLDSGNDDDDDAF